MFTKFEQIAHSGGQCCLPLVQSSLACREQTNFVFTVFVTFFIFPVILSIACLVLRKETAIM